MVGSAPHWQRLLVLAPVFVIGAGIVGAVMILVVRAFADSFRDFRYKRVAVAGFIAMIVLVVVLTYFGIQLPKEG